MRSYKIARRSFLAAVGGAFGLRTMLRNIEASAQGEPPPPRFLMTHWPVGTLEYWFRPSGGSSTTYSPTRILQPFEDAGLRDDMIVFWGFNQDSGSGQGGGHESGTPMMSTCARCPGTRENGGEPDDGCAGGPSFDQIFLRSIPALQTPGAGYVNAIADARVDSQETSTQCLSYSYDTRQIQSARPGGNITENVPLLPELSPLQLFNNLFSGFMPTNPSEPNANQEAVLQALVNRQSVIDHSLSELAQLRLLAPASEWDKIDAHVTALRNVETELADRIANGAVIPECTLPTAPESSLTGKTGSRVDYNDPATSTADDEIHEQVGKAHASIIRAAFACDLIRVATFQWSPGTNHVSFGGLYPDEPSSIYMHHPLSHRITDHGLVTGMTAPTSGSNLADIEFLANVQVWYNQRHADIINEFKNTADVFGANLLDQTVIPYVTEVAETTHSWGPTPAIVFGGRALGIQGGQYIEVGGGGSSRFSNYWHSIGQALAREQAPALEGAPEGTPIAGVWSPPA